MLNFIWAPKILKETIETKFQGLKTQETNNADPLFEPENIMSLRNRNVIIHSQDVQLKFILTIFSYFLILFWNVFSYIILI